MSEFEIGRLYNRRKDIHQRFGGQQQGGICTPRSLDAVIIFTGDAGIKHGYEDRMQPDGVFLYYGEGQLGDMELVRGNLAVATHVSNGKRLLLFEYVDRGVVRFVNECRCLDFHKEEAPDREGNLRHAIVFELEILGDESQPVVADVSDKEPGYWKLSLAELQHLAEEKPPPKSKTATRRVVIRRRSEAVKVFALKRANGVCEGCEQASPFVDKAGRPFLEVHHLHRRADGGPDKPENVIAICPNCHRRVHLGRDGNEFNQRLIGVRTDD